MTAKFTPDQLFNCCAGGTEPDWSQYDALELGGCVNDSEDPEETHVIGGIELAEAEFFCVYGHLKGGGVEAITDVNTFTEAVLVARHLSALSGLEYSVEC